MKRQPKLFDVHEPKLTFGEFGHILLSQEQYDKLKARLNGSTEHYIELLDLWACDHPAKFGRFKSHYRTILQWFNRDVIKEHRKGKVAALYHPTVEEALAMTNGTLKARGAKA